MDKIDMSMLETHYMVNVSTNWISNYGFAKKEDIDMYTNGKYIYNSVKVIHPYNDGKFVIIPIHEIYKIKSVTIEEIVGSLMN